MLITAHRGSTTYITPNGEAFIENSLSAIAHCIEDEKIDAIETDIYRTKDGHFVLMNYATLEEVSPLVGSISDYTLEELQAVPFTAHKKNLDKVLGSADDAYGTFTSKVKQHAEVLAHMSHQIPTLENVLALPGIENKRLFIEIKTTYTKENNMAEIENYVEALKATISKDMSNIVFIGRDTDTLSVIAENFPNNHCFPVIGYNDTEKALLPFPGVSVAVNHLEKEIPGTGKTLLSYLQETGKEIAIWNVVSSDTVRHLLLTMNCLSVYMTSDYADLINDFCESY